MSIFGDFINRRFSTRPLNSAFNANTYSSILSNFNYQNNLPAWVSLQTPEYYESAVRFNPVVNSAIRLKASTASNGKKYLVDIKTGEEVDWGHNEVTKKIKRLLIDKPNPIQSGKEYDYQGIFYLETFGNRYVYGLMPSGFDNELDVMNIEALWNLPSQFMSLKTTGNIYNQYKLSGIVSSYCDSSTSPVTNYDPNAIMHYNDVNISKDYASLMGISKLEALRDPIRNIEACFQAVNTLLRTGGAKGIISIDSKDGQGSIVPLQPGDKAEVDKEFRSTYGTQDGQSPFLISPVPLNYEKIAMTAKELGIYEELSNNTMQIANVEGVPPDLIKADPKNTTYENRRQSMKALYQDTTIPSVEDSDKYTSSRLNLEKYGFELKTKWCHIPVLAEDEKEKATTNSLNEKSAKSAYDSNLITWNKYLELTGLSAEPNGDIYKFQRDEQT